MAQLTISNIQLAGLASAVPEQTLDITNVAAEFGEAEAQKISKAIGVEHRHADSSLCASDLCYVAATNLLQELNWSAETIDLLVCVTQTPDYLLPATSCVLHERLHLSKSCMAFDVNMGCSGYIYGLSIVAKMLDGKNVKRALLLVGDTISRIVSPFDRSTAPLFGDAGSATALEFNESANPMHFVLGTDGNGHQHLAVPASGFRLPRNQETSQRKTQSDGNMRSQEELYMNGAEIFTFTLREVPPLIEDTLSIAGWSTDSVDAYVFHQANSFMLKHLVKRMKLPADRVPLSIKDYGNTSSASIPLTLTTCLKDELQQYPQKLLLAGFGVGLSWGAVSFETHTPVVVPPIIHVPSQALVEQ